MIGLPSSTRRLAADVSDMRTDGNSLAVKMTTASVEDPFSGSVFKLRGLLSDIAKRLW